MALLDAVGTGRDRRRLPVGVVPVVVGLFVFGFGQGAWDVAMNVRAPWSNAGSDGRSCPDSTPASASGPSPARCSGPAMVALDVPVTAHLFVSPSSSAVVVPLAVRGFLPDSTPTHRGTPTGAAAAAAARGAWREPRTLLVGLFVLAFAFAEGTGNDWIERRADRRLRHLRRSSARSASRRSWRR